MKCFLVDGSGFLFRAYHGYPAMTNDDWQNINVVYGFFRILMKLMMQKPEYLLITRDLPSPTKRHQMDSDYKANRPEVPEDFKQQIPRVQQTVADLGIPHIGVPGYEADDVIATVVRRLQDEKVTTFIVSSDKDLKQLLGPETFVLDPMKDSIYGETDFVQEYNFAPQHMLDYLSLVGDTADNIKWVPGIGPKSASQLVQTYHTVENIYDHIEEIPASTQKKLLEGKESAFHSKKLVELMHVDALDSLTLDDYDLSPDISLFRQILVQKFKFQSMDKLLTDLQKKFLAPTQTSLF